MPLFELDEYEADDILGALSRQAAEKGMDVVIVTGDADAMQLVGPHVKVLYPKSRNSFTDTTIYDGEAVSDKYGVRPEHIADLKALQGDSSDNILGVPGVGAKTAVKLIQRFGPIEQIYKHLDEVEPERLKQLLKENEGDAHRSKKLTTIVTELPISLKPQEASLDRFDRQKVTDFFRQLGFSSLLPRLDAVTAVLSGKSPVATIPQLEKDYRVVDTVGDMDDLARRLSGLKSFSFDTETTGLDPLSARLVGISISPTAAEASYIPVAPSGHDGEQLALEEAASDEEKRLPLEMIVASLGQQLADAKIAKTAHNSKYDISVLMEHGIEVNNLAFDTMIAAYLLGEPSLGLKSLAFSHLGIEMIPITELIGTGNKQITMAQVPVADVTDYACADADVTGQLAIHFKCELEKYGLTSLFRNVEMPLVPVLIAMERNGVALDVKLLTDISYRLGQQIQQIEEEIYSVVGHRFNINSPQQLGAVLFEEMKMPSLRKTKSGHSTDASVLEELRGRYPLAGFILEYRTLSKLKSTYVDALPRLVNARTERLHTSFNQTRTATGRLSSSNPNLQNIPVRDQLAREIRRAFVAPEGSKLMAADYSQIDLRALAHLSGDAGLIAAFKHDEDIHTATAIRLYGTDGEQVKPEMRRLAKVVNFGIIYGMSSYGLEQATELSREEAHSFISTYFDKYPGVARYLEETKQQVRKRGYVQTLLGRRRYLPDINSPNRQVRESAERMAINMPVQGTSADIIKVAMVKLHAEMDKRRLKSKLILQVHDELIFEVPDKELEEIYRLIPDTMANAVILDVPLKVDIKTGDNWGEME
jgi:DNA polymerase-1